jgi:hypothetical protein
MADILFDKLAYIDRLTRAGVSEEIARAHADALDRALREFREKLLAQPESQTARKFFG